MMYLLTSLLGLVAADPSGHYYGTKSIMFHNIKVDMKTGAPGEFSLSVKGAPSGNVDCPKEAFAVAGTKLTMPNGDKAGDCAHDQFKAAKLVFNGADYDSAADTITVHAKYLFVTVTIVCKKVATDELFAPELGAPSAAPRDFQNPNYKRLAGCASSPNRQHTRAQGVINFSNSCADVSAEIQARVNGQNGWRDPHNRGNYQMESVQGNTLKLKRRTGNNRYTDQVSFVMNQGATADACSVLACSVSQSNSNNDAGTNMCNMGNLFCNSNVRNNNQGTACRSITKDLTYTVANLECGRYRTDGRYREHNCQDFATTCLRQPAMLEDLMFNLGENEEFLPEFTEDFDFDSIDDSEFAWESWMEEVNAEDLEEFLSLME